MGASKRYHHWLHRLKQQTIFKMTQYPTICLLLAVLSPMVCSVAESEGQKDPKLISTFQVVRFPNDNCQGSNNRNGTCYTSQECSSKSGTSAGSCADGFGVCCTFIINTCGSTSSENLTVWQSPTTVTTGSCPLTICPTSDDICSLRLDFTTFTLTGPSTLSVANVRRRFGQGGFHNPNAAGDASLEGSTYTGACLVDNFYVTSSSPSTTPPSVCGNNAGQHMYVEADKDRCNLMRFSFGDATTVVANQVTNTRGVTTTATRSWDITITQIECSSVLRPPTGCTKYWYGAGVATLTNYNFQTTVAAGNVHLAMQHERMCIRRERGMCIGCFSAAVANFAVSWNAAMNIVTTGGCCGYGTRDALVEFAQAAVQAGLGQKLADDDQQFGWDCVIIPGAYIPVIGDEGEPLAIQTTALIQQSITNSPTEANGPSPSGPQICGSGAGLGMGKDNSLNEMIVADLADGDLVRAEPNTICTRNVPFQLEFMSDELEGLGGSEDEANESEMDSATQQFGQGFSIDFQQYAC